jgi:hypothetical protein
MADLLALSRPRSRILALCPGPARGSWRFVSASPDDPDGFASASPDDPDGFASASPDDPDGFASAH